MRLCEDCQKVEVTRRREFCHDCIRERSRKRQEVRNMERQAARVCRCGCGEPAPPRMKYAAGHYEAIRKKQVARNNKNRTKKLNKPPECAKPKERKAVKIIMTSEQVHEALKLEDARLKEVRASLPAGLLAMRQFRGAMVPVDGLYEIR